MPLTTIYSVTGAVVRGRTSTIHHLNVSIEMDPTPYFTYTGRFPALEESYTILELEET